LAISKASLIGAIVTGRVLGALPRLALTALIGSGRYHRVGGREYPAGR
jgi:hypothetical protein